MRSLTYITFFASSAVALQYVSIFNPYFDAGDSLTILASSAGTTTYKGSCPSDDAGVSILSSGWNSPTAAPAPTAKPRVRRQAIFTDPDYINDDVGYDICEPYTLVQGASTWEFHATDPLPGAWTMDVACRWEGTITAADLTCTATENGYAGAVTGVSTTVLNQDDIDDNAYQLVSILNASAASSTGAPSVSASPTSSASSTASTSSTRSTSSTASTSSNASASASGSAARSSSLPAQKTALAPAGPLPTGAIVLVGGAAGALAAALAL